MASWGSFACVFFVGFFVGQVTLGFFLAFLRKGSAFEIVDSPPLAAGLETSALNDPFLVEPASEADQIHFKAVPPTATIQSPRRRPTPQMHLDPRQ
jgi:hypothetical protein